MPSLPSATTRLQDESGGLAVGSDLLAVLAPVATLDDETPRLFSSTQSLYDTHGYAQGVDFCAIYIEATGLPILFVPLTIGTVGAVSRQITGASWGATSTSTVTCSAGGNGCLDECDIIVRAGNSGTVGTGQLLFDLSLDGGRTFKSIRLGTNNSYTIPYIGAALSFGAGTFVSGDTLMTCHTSAPKASDAAITAAKTALADQERKVRGWIYIGDCSTSSDTSALKTAVDAYETSDERYVLAKACLRDRYPYASMSQSTVRMTGSPNVTFAEVGATGDTITRSAGSFVADGFAVGDIVTIVDSVSNDGTTLVGIAGVSALVLTLDTDDLVDEGPVAGVTITATPAITFAEVGATGDTITRSSGSWITDGFRAGDNITIADSASNDGTTTAGLDTVTALVLTLDTDDLAAEVIGQAAVTITAGETDAVAIAALDSAFATVTDDPRMDLGYGRGSMRSPIHGSELRRNVQWPDAILAFQRDMALTTWWKALGSISSRIPAGFDLQQPYGWPYAAAGAQKQAFEHDERSSGGALGARFTCARTWGNGPAGAFIAQSLTRETDGAILGMTHKLYVSSLAQTVVQATTENFAGQTLVLNDDGTPTSASLKQFENKVNGQLRRYLLSNVGGDGPRASSAVWTAATDDDLSLADAILHGSLALKLLGTVVHISTAVKVS